MAEFDPRQGLGPVKTIMLILCGMIVLALGALAVFHITLSLRIHKHLAAIRAAGYPVTLEEWNAWYLEVPEAENAAAVYDQAFALYAEYPTSGESADELPVVGTAQLPARNEPIPEEMRARIAGYLGENAEALQLLHKAATMDKCRFPIDVTEGVSITLPHLSKLRQGARLLYVEGIFRAEEGRGDDAAESVKATVRLAGSVSNEPLIISSLVRIACLSLARAHLERVLSRTTVSEGKLAELSKSFEEAEGGNSLTRGIAGERCSQLSIFRDIRQLAGDNLGLGKPVNMTTLRASRVSGIMKLDELSSIEIMNEMVAICELPIEEQETAMQSMNLEAKVMALPRFYLVTRMMVPALGRATSEHVKCAARLRTARTACAVERYRLKNGRLPENLDALVPEFMTDIPTDPFDGQPLLYLPRSPGYVVYSVGEDGLDDQGTEEENRGQPDVTFNVER